MKKLLVNLICILLALTLFPVSCFAAGKSFSAFDASEIGEAVKRSAGYGLESPYSYIAFQGVDLTGIKTVSIKAKCNMDAGDGDMFRIHIDNPKTGKFLGYVEMAKDCPNEAMEFKGAIEAVSGVHTVYIVSSIGCANNSVITEVSFLTDEYVKEKYVPVSDAARIDTHYTTWALTDDLGRKAATYEEVGPLKEDKEVGMFYWTWHLATTTGTRIPINLSEYVKQHPDAVYDYNHPAWISNSRYYWNEPLFGFYRGDDYWVMRKHVQMLSNAGVDVLFFDATNDAATYRQRYDVLYQALYDAKKDGMDVPKVAFITPFGKNNGSAKQNIMRLYFGSYYEGRWSDLWYYLDGKPLVLGYSDMLTGRENDERDASLMQEIKNFFTWRSCQPMYDTGQKESNQWSWLEIYPQHGFTKKEDGSYEMISVAVAANYSELLKDKVAMNNKDVMGRSYTKRFGQDKALGAYKYGYFFTEQLNHALTVDAKMLFIDGWNEWTVGRNAYWQNVTNAFGDTFDNEGSRDIEPTKGDMKDNYYCLLVDAVRKWKGAEPVPTAGVMKAINLNDFSEWDLVTPTYYNDKGTYDRNSVSYNITYENHTARNNVIRAKVSRDGENMYFFAECAAAITDKAGSDWMKLYIDVDRNRPTGWEGYDYVINYPAAGDVSVLDADGGATKIANAEFNVMGTMLAVKVPRATLNLTSTLNFEFKWVDNADGDILNYYSNGNIAPMGRFNYVYTEIEERALSQELREQLKGITVVKDGSSKAIVNGGKQYALDRDIRCAAKRINGVMYFPAELLYDAFGNKVTWDPERNVLKIFGDSFAYTVAGSGQIRIDGVLKTLTNPAVQIDGVPYIPVTMLKENLGFEVYESGSVAAFGKGINGAVINGLAAEF